MRLYHAKGSPHSASVRIALAEKELAFEAQVLDLAAFENLGTAFIKANSSGQVPVLEDGKCRITETFFILLYLDEQYPSPPLGGPDPRARYSVQKWGKYVETHIAPNLALLRWSGAQEGAAVPPPEALERLPEERRALWSRAARGFYDGEIATARQALERAADRIAADLADNDWLAGDDFTLADIAVYPHAARLADAGIALPRAVEAWLGRMRARPIVAADEANEQDLITMGPERGRWG